MAKRSFLSVFATIGHAVEAAAKIAAPIVATLDPQIGGLMSMATSAAVGIEAVITQPGAGQQKADAVAAQTKAAIDVANSILASQNKPPLPANTADVIAHQVGVVVAGLNGVSQAVGPVADAAASGAK